jgi:Cys-rich four helix bundle protein (predicted Tat secretion target)
MKRREVFQVASGTAIAHTVVTVFGCAAAPKTAEAPKADPAKAPPPPVAVSPVTPALAKAAEAAAHCVVACETCLEHCIRDLSTGSTMMAECAKIVQQMLVLCRAMASLAAMGSPHAKQLAALCIEVCVECRTACEKHAGHHAECKACAEACAACEAACKALV